jgi:ribosomal protein L14E/L6E/L27E
VTILDKNDLIGKIVYSKAGRDKDQYFVIVGILNENFVYIANGDIRNIENPKKKKVKHLIFTEKTCENIREDIFNGKKLVMLS